MALLHELENHARCKNSAVLNAYLMEMHTYGYDVDNFQFMINFSPRA